MNSVYRRFNLTHCFHFGTPNQPKKSSIILGLRKWACKRGKIYQDATLLWLRILGINRKNHDLRLLRGSNPRPYAYWAHALPTELRSLTWLEEMFVLIVKGLLCNVQKRMLGACSATCGGVWERTHSQACWTQRQISKCTTHKAKGPHWWVATGRRRVVLWNPSSIWKQVFLYSKSLCWKFWRISGQWLQVASF